MSSFYEFRMLNLPSKYKINELAVAMIKAHEDMVTGRIDEAEVGRRIRLSPGRRTALLDTVTKCVNMISKKPEESKNCLAVIHVCLDVLKIADNHRQAEGFPNFLKLPTEIRQRIIGFYLGGQSYVGVSNWGDPWVVPRNKKCSCLCAPHDPNALHPKNLSLAFTSKQMRDEALTLFYKRSRIHFPCACEMGWHLTQNADLREKIRNVRFHWCGPESDKGIAALRPCKLEELTVIVSKVTSKYPNEREQELQKHFTRTVNAKVGLALPECLGFEELSALRGVGAVTVSNCHMRRALPRSEEDRSNLTSWLSATITKPREDVDEDD